MQPVDPKGSSGNLIPANGASVTVSYFRRTVKMHPVTRGELESIASSGNSVNLTFFGISAGSLVSFAITLTTIDITDPIKHATFVSLTWISSLSSIYFAVRSFVDARKSKRRLRELLESEF